MLGGTRVARAGLFAAIGLSVAHAAAADLHQTEARLKQEYASKTITLRRFYSASFLHYNRTGALQSRSEEGPWTLWSKVQVTAIKLNPDNVEIAGRREFVRFRHHSNRPATMEFLHTDHSVAIRIDLDAAPTGDGVHAALARVLVGSNEEFVTVAPPYWREFLRREMGGASRQTGGGDQPQSGSPSEAVPVRVNPGVAHTRLLREVRPQYPLIARQLNAQGSVILRVIIGTSGQSRDVWILSPVGIGLDDAAVEAVRQWIFRPWMVDGKDIEVQTEVTVKYQLKR
jgi:TonB family protein